MRPGLQPALVNEPFGDPGVFVDFLFERRAILFDLGDLHALAPKKILRISDIFVSHCHMDHFMGFDWLLRICLGRDRGVRLFGPAGFVDQVAAKLAAYTWNLVHRYENDFVLTVHEVHADGSGRRASFRVGSAFQREEEAAVRFEGLVLLEEAGLRVRAAVLDHGTPCLGFALEEKHHVNIWKNHLADLGLAVGPWLQGLKRAVLAGSPPETPIEGPDGRQHCLGDLAACLEVSPGLKIAYVTDVVHSPENAARILDLARDADWLFIESAFLDVEADHAAEKKHLTAGQAGRLARAAGARNVVPFHFSPVYRGREAELQAELERAWRGRFYPAGLPESEWLAYYARRFASVELNASFYRLPSRQQFAAWRQQTPAGFVFSVKASRYITHLKKLLAAEATLPPLLEATAGLGEKRGPLLFQLPPRWRVNAARLRGVLGALPPDCRAVFEFRDPSWHKEAVRQLLEEYGAGWCVFDLAGVQSPRLVTAGIAYLRLHGPGAAYRGRYGRAALAEWAAWLADQPVAEAYVYFDNDEVGHAVEDALEMQALLA